MIQFLIWLIFVIVVYTVHVVLTLIH